MGSKSSYQDDISVWVAAVYPSLACLSLSFLSLGMDGLGRETEFSQPFVVAFMRVVALITIFWFIVGFIVDLIMIPKLIWQESQRWDREKTLSVSRLFALLVLPPSQCILAVWVLHQIH